MPALLTELDVNETEIMELMSGISRRHLRVRVSGHEPDAVLRQRAAEHDVRPLPLRYREHQREQALTAEGQPQIRLLRLLPGCADLLAFLLHVLCAAHEQLLDTVAL